MKSQKTTIEIRKTTFAMMTILCFMAFVAPNAALGITTSWTGASNTNWFDAANWNNGVPGASDTAQINKDVVNPQKKLYINAEAGVTGVCYKLTQGGATSPYNHVLIYSPLHVLNNYICGAYYGYADMACYAGSSLIIGNMFSIGGAGDGPYYGQGVVSHYGGSIAVGGNMFVGYGSKGRISGGYGRYYGTAGTLTVGGNMSVGFGIYYYPSVGEFTIGALDMTVGGVFYNGRGGSYYSPYTGGNGNGTTTINGGSLVVTGDFINADGFKCYELKTYGRFNVTGGEIDLQSNFTNGTGFDADALKLTFPTIKVSGADATFHVGGNFSSISNSVLVAELAGPTHTAIRVDGNVALDGTFQATINGVYRPQYGDSWEIIVADADGSGGHALSGSFHTVDLSAIEHIGDFRLRYDTAGKKVVLALHSPGTVFLVR